MVDKLKDLLENPIGDGVDQIREEFDALFGELPREDRMAFMLLLSVPYVLNENAAIQIELAAKHGKLPGPASLEIAATSAVMQFATAVKTAVEAGVRMSQEARKNKGK